MLEDGFGAPFEDSTRVKLSRLFPAGDKSFRFEYEYDFGDAWRHEIVLEGTSPPQAGVEYPLCLGGARAQPPEDVGGIPGYEDLLEALSDPKHEQHDDALESFGSFQPEQFDAAVATRRMQEGLPDWRVDDIWL